MVLYNELGRHTPPPPPYSLNKRDTTKAKLAEEVSQGPAPPPPPPYLNRTSISDCTIPPIEDIWRQAVIPDDSQLRSSGNNILLPPVPPQRCTAQVFNSQQRFGDLDGNRNPRPSSLGVPAHPVEPKWAPVGSISYLGPPMGGAATRVAKFPPEKLGQSTTQSCVFDAGTRIRPEHVKSSFQSPSTVSLGQIIASSPTHALATVTRMDQVPPHLFRKQSNKDNTSLTRSITTNATASLENPNNTNPLSAPLSQPAIKRYTTPATLDELSVVQKVTDVNYLVDADKDSSSDGDLSHGDDKFTRLFEAPKAQEYTSPAPPKYEPQPSTDRTNFSKQTGGLRVSHTSHRRPSASARFEPYQRHQSTKR